MIELTLEPPKSHQRIPQIVRQLCWLYDAWIIGSGADFTKVPKDIDVVVPLDRWAAFWIPVISSDIQEFRSTLTLAEQFIPLHFCLGYLP